MASTRRKIENNPAKPEYILTEIGIGYRMRERDKEREGRDKIVRVSKMILIY